MAKRNPVTDPILKKWLNEFKAKSTQKAYLTCMRNYKKLLNIDALQTYLDSSPDVETDLKIFLSKLDGRPSKSIEINGAVVKVFLQDYGFEIKNSRKLRRRGFMPRKPKPRTKDKKPTKEQLKKVLNYADLKGRALFLFLASSGARIGETLQLTKSDLSLEADPPSAFFRAETTKGGVGERTAFMSYEARDSIQDWLNIKDSLHKRHGGSYAGDKVFPWNYSTARYMWNHACEKAGMDERDSRTKMYVYHIHSLRKFFRSKIGLDVDMAHSLMGHNGYLDESYVRFSKKEIAEAYREVMGNVSVYQVEDQELKKQTKEQRDEIAELRAQVAELRELFEASIEVHTGQPTRSQADRVDDEVDAMIKRRKQ